MSFFFPSLLWVFGLGLCIFPVSSPGRQVAGAQEWQRTEWMRGCGTSPQCAKDFISPSRPTPHPSPSCSVDYIAGYPVLWLPTGWPMGSTDWCQRMEESVIHLLGWLQVGCLSLPKSSAPITVPLLRRNPPSSSRPGDSNSSSEMLVPGCRTVLRWFP